MSRSTCREKVFVIYFSRMAQLSHVDDQGRVRMVDTGNKEVTPRRAVASARVLMTKETVAALREHRTPKGDPLEAARLAGIMAAKRTSDLIPLCHPLPLTHIDVRRCWKRVGGASGRSLDKRPNRGRNGGADGCFSGALTVYDMCKALEKGMTITDVRLDSKTGGKSGDYDRAFPQRRKRRKAKPFKVCFAASFAALRENFLAVREPRVSIVR